MTVSSSPGSDARDPAAAGNGDHGRPGTTAAEPGRRSPGWREVLAVAGAVVLVVLVVEAVSVNVGAIGDLFAHSPLTILVLVVVTVSVLAAIARRSLRP